MKKLTLGLSLALCGLIDAMATDTLAADKMISGNLRLVIGSKRQF